MLDVGFIDIDISDITKALNPLKGTFGSGPLQVLKPLSTQHVKCLPFTTARQLEL